MAADIGGTKTDMALYADGDDGPRQLLSERYRNRDAAGFDDLMDRFLARCGQRPLFAVIAVAGPVRDGRVRMTNLGWLLDGDALAERFSLNRVILINDLVATAMAAVHSPHGELVTINRGEPDRAGNVAVLAPGTGLGEAFVLRHRGHWLPMASEGGHGGFAPANDVQMALLRYLSVQGRKKVSVEDVCSGLGLPGLYRFWTRQLDIPAPVLDLDPAEQTPAIVAAALDALKRPDREGNPCLRAVHLLIDILAAEAGDMALAVLATGGVYIGGGLPPRLVPLFDPPAFMNLFARGVYQDMLARIPVHILTNPRAALHGAALYGYQQFRPTGEP
jgi:glucokinase